jgi:hypothetical protein
MVQEIGDGADPGFGETLGSFPAETLDLSDVDGGETSERSHGFTVPPN